MKGKRILKSLFVAAAIGVASFAVGIVVFDFAMKLVVGQGDEVSVPGVLGLDESEANRVLEENGLYIVSEGTRHDAATDSGTVLTQQPDEGERVKRGRRIHVTTSLGPERLFVPEVSGRRVRQAKIALSRAGLRAESIIGVPHDQVERDLVIATSPVAGTPAIEGESVQLLVSLGPERSSFLLPDLRGKKESEVRRHLNLFGLGLARVAYLTGGEQPGAPGVVVSQVPPAGAEVDSRSSIEVEVVAP